MVLERVKFFSVLLPHLNVARAFNWLVGLMAGWAIGEKKQAEFGPTSQQI